MNYVIVRFTVISVMYYLVCDASFEESSDKEEGRVDYSHDDVVETFVLLAGKPPFEGQNEEEYFDDVEGWIVSDKPFSLRRFFE